MKITTGLALPIVNQLISVVNFNVNIMDENGTIVASGDPQRIGQQHEGALQVLLSKQQMVIGENEMDSYTGSKPGVNLPIEFQNKIVGVVGITGNPDEVYKFGTIIKMNVEILLQQIFMSKQVQYRKMALEGWVLDLINPYEFAERKLEMTAKSLDIDYELERYVMLVEIEEMKWGEEPMNASMLQKIEERKEHLLNEFKMLLDKKTIATYVEEGTFFIAIPSKEDMKRNRPAKIVEQLKKLDFHINLGIGNSYQGIIGYKESYNQAKQSIRLMKKFQKEEKLSFIDEWGIIRYLDALPREIQKSFLDKYLPSPTVWNEEYKHTLNVFLECDLDVKQTSNLLHIHRNTLFYRLDKISQLLQLDYRKFSDLVVMRLLLIFDRLKS
jgi:carbohydrate diacid regulator